MVVYNGKKRYYRSYLNSNSTTLIYRYILIGVLGVISNTLLLVAFRKDPLKCFRNSATYLVMNLSVCDGLTCLFAPFFHVFILNSSAYYYLQSIYEFLVYWFGTVSMVSITSISIDRFLTVSYPIKHRTLINGKVIIMWLVLIWLGSSIVPAVELFFHREGKKILVTNIFITIIIMVFYTIMYSWTYCKLNKQSKNMAVQNSTESLAQQMRNLKEKRFLQTIILIACIAFACLVPSAIFWLIYDFLSSTTNETLLSILKSIIVSIFYTNFAANPLIYIIRFPNYRRTFYRLYWKRGS